MLRLCWLIVVQTTVSGLSTTPPDITSLQDQHKLRTPSSLMTALAKDCEFLGIEKIDVYGDFNSTKDESYLRSFEAEVAGSLGKEDAVFMPSGVMAQSIALLIHNSGDTIEGRVSAASNRCESGRGRFACHHSSHLLLHEDEGFRHLLFMEPLIISTKRRSNGEKGDGDDNGNDEIGIPPLTFSDVKLSLDGGEGRDTTGLSTLILELPHRELGGKLTPWDDVQKIKMLCAERGIKFHCDGARLFEASAGYGLTLSELCDPFDSVYVSFYKGLGGISGAMLVGDAPFCAEARLWLRRFGGNLYTLLPYAISGWAGYRRHITADIVTRQEQPPKEQQTQKHQHRMTFVDKRDKMRRIVSALSCPTEPVCQVLSFDPSLPQTNMVHGYIRSSVGECLDARDAVERDERIRVFNRVRDVDENDAAFQLGYRSKFEYAIGDYNGAIDDSTYLRGWNKFASILLESEKSAQRA